jgi:hypothetical protein
MVYSSGLKAISLIIMPFPQGICLMNKTRRATVTHIACHKAYLFQAKLQKSKRAVSSRMDNSCVQCSSCFMGIFHFLKGSKGISPNTGISNEM